MSDEKDDIKFRLAVEDRRHNELASLLKQLITAAQSDVNKDSELTRLIQKSYGNIDVLLDKVKDITKPIVESPIVNIDMGKVSTSLNTLTQEIIKLKSEQERTNELLEERNMIAKMPVKMIPKQGYSGKIEEVLVETIIPKNKTYLA